MRFLTKSAKDFSRIALAIVKKLPKNEADGNPVGEKWDEPNHSPVLVQPTEGRGMGDRLRAMVGGFPNVNLGFAGMFKKLIIGLVIGGVIILLLFVLMMFKP